MNGKHKEYTHIWYVAAPNGIEKPKPRKATNLMAKESFLSPGHAKGRCLITGQRRN
jgi:hypothetical protein